MPAHVFGNQELGILRPAIGTLGEADFLFSQRLAMGGGGIDFVRRAIADMAVEDDQSRPTFGLPEHRERFLDALQIIGVPDPKHVPMIPEEAGRHALGYSATRIALDGD